jgi:hypothetical protein
VIAFRLDDPKRFRGITCLQHVIPGFNEDSGDQGPDFALVVHYQHGGPSVHCLLLHGGEHYKCMDRART